MEQLRLVTIKKQCKRQHTRIQEQKNTLEFLNRQAFELKAEISHLTTLNNELSEFIADECAPTTICNPYPDYNNNNNYNNNDNNKNSNNFGLM